MSHCAVLVYKSHRHHPLLFALFDFVFRLSVCKHGRHADSEATYSSFRHLNVKSCSLFTWYNFSIFQEFSSGVILASFVLVAMAASPAKVKVDINAFASSQYLYRYLIENQTTPRIQAYKDESAQQLIHELRHSTAKSKYVCDMASNYSTARNRSASPEPPQTSYSSSSQPMLPDNPMQALHS